MRKSSFISIIISVALAVALGYVFLSSEPRKPDDTDLPGENHVSDPSTTGPPQDPGTSITETSPPSQLGIEPPDVLSTTTVTSRVPENSIVINGTMAATVEAPFRKYADPTAVDGTSLFIPERAGTGQGHVAFPFDVPIEGAYYVWARAWWRDSCGNSMDVQIDGGKKNSLGQDAIYRTWHWVRAGGFRPTAFDLSRGRHELAILEREDGLAFDQILVTPDPDFTPAEPIGVKTSQPALRRFADDFLRSPGHGNEAWEFRGAKWKIAFSYDPNRVPDQFGLVGEAAGHGDALALVRGAPWSSSQLRFSFSPQTPGEYGAVLDSGADDAPPLYLVFQCTQDKSQLTISGSGVAGTVDLTGLMRLNQWHRIEVDRWAWALTVTVDDREVFRTFDATPRKGALGFMVRSGKAVFDDMDVASAPFQADDGKRYAIVWTEHEGADWRRESSGGGALIGRAGAISTALSGLTVEEIFVRTKPGKEESCNVVAPGFEAVPCGSQGRLYRPSGSKPVDLAQVEFRADGSPVHIAKLAVRYGAHVPDTFTYGPYHFTSETIEDWADYEDFTPEEVQQMTHGPDARRDRRKPRIRPVLGKGRAEYSPWEEDLTPREMRIHGRFPTTQLPLANWAIRDGVLIGAGPAAVLRHAQEFNCFIDMTFRLRMAKPGSEAEVELYGGPEPGLRLRTVSPGTASPVELNVLSLPFPNDNDWHTVQLSVREGEAMAQVDNTEPVRCRFVRGDGGRVFLRVTKGVAHFDDIEFKIPERTGRHFVYPFDRREPDWWREGGPWLDHAGMACALASNWISLVALKGEGMLWNKRQFGPDVLVSIKVLEYSYWHAWGYAHYHYPYDNIAIVIGTEKNVDAGYRLEVNSRNRTSTVLYRNGQEAAVRRQDESFPIQYAGQHAPYWPRRNEISLVKRGGIIRAIVNGEEVLRYEDPDPLDVRMVGIGGYNTRINFGTMEVRQISPGPIVLLPQ